MTTVLITGGTGLIGSALCKLLLTRGYKVIILTRNPKPPAHGVAYAGWDVERKTIDEQAIANADHVIHLAGAGVADKRWTRARKEQILMSRVKSSNFLVETLRNVPNKVSTVISASGIGWYGSDRPGGRAFVETDPADPGFLGQTCQLWEQSISSAAGLGIRTVVFRTGIVLSNEGGALPSFAAPLKGRVAAILGSGTQMISWIHITDLCRMYLHALEQPHVSGIYNAAAPFPVTNGQLMVSLARSRNRAYIPVFVPSFLLRIVLGEMSVEVLKSTTVDPRRISAAGFEFLYPKINEALHALKR